MHNEAMLKKLEAVHAKQRISGSPSPASSQKSISPCGSTGSGSSLGVAVMMKNFGKEKHSRAAMCLSAALNRPKEMGESPKPVYTDLEEADVNERKACWMVEHDALLELMKRKKNPG